MKNQILLKGLDLSYSKEAKKFKKRMLGNAGSVQLKNINIHLYEGEVLGLLSDAETLFYIKEVLSGTLNPVTGKVKTHGGILSLDVMDHINNPFSLSFFIEELLEEYKSGKQFAETVEMLHNKPVIGNNLKKKMKDLSRKQLAHILLEISALIEVEVIIYTNFHKYLGDLNKFRSVVNMHENSGRGILLLETSLEPIEKIANYFTWVSYGQIRFEGSVEQGVESYNKYLREKSMVKNIEQEALFDLEWKRHVYEDEMYNENFKRLGKQQASILDNINIRKIIVTLVLAFIMVLSALVIFMNISFIGETPTFTEEQQNMGGEVTSERLSYAFVDRDGLEIDGTSLPQYTLLEVTDTDEETYTVSYGNAEAAVKHDEVIYFNPASLYTEDDFMSLLEYASPVIQNNYMFYSNYLNGSREFLEQNITFDVLDENHGSVAGIPITYHFSGDTVFSMEFEGAEKNTITEDLNLSGEVTIFRVDQGFMIYDSVENNWNYLIR
ncbi:teichoic acid ABC transporter ATP-binding protein [Jeotgalicoccus coquinae]|uniref:Teichoic acid transport system ATP-binding protein n=1 Tax=Jeotgalicoccus coquinae TaxID=709509 RepID=A0A6V7RQP1_9STAP|nr:hypothetical protein [Jeotgalicoccus coquinae]MBB6424093.1 teichoic acid transport system ATP-binding protein [Jeotgalicoccus coquinae]GGE26589.1 teichoic acid ABC transporter ATP-binding protein [Jeotgalicoccus coquinae]CAD2081239.1 Teichoic acids export ATP-binding protein TagH [Jeotgalicoccus coquinae]